MRRIFPNLLFVLFVLFNLALSLPAAGADERYRANVDRCLANWKDSPFGSTSDYRLIESRVGVFGIGGGIRDDTPTPEPELVYVTMQAAAIVAATSRAASVIASEAVACGGGWFASMSTR